MRLQASGYPSWVKTEEDKDSYIRQYMQAEGVQLVKEEIERNEALRSLAKLGLNSFWVSTHHHNDRVHLENT